MDIEHEKNITQRGSRKRAHTGIVSTFTENCKTPTRSTEMNYEVITTPVLKLKNEFQQTPRRSGRKSIKPVQDYEEIVVGRTLRSSKKEAKPFELEECEEAQPKWTPAKVGRVSQKRSKKSKKSKKINQSINDGKNEHDQTCEAEKKEDSVLVDVSQAADALNKPLELASNVIGANVENEVHKLAKLYDFDADATNLDHIEVDSITNESKTVESIVNQTDDDFIDLNDEVFEEPEKSDNTSFQIKTIIQEKMLSDKDQDMPSLIEEFEEAQPKWTPAEVGRVSQKRSKKSKKSKKINQSINDGKNELDQTCEAENKEDVSQAADALDTTFEMAVKEKNKIELASNIIGANVENEVHKLAKLNDFVADAINSNHIEVDSINNESKTVENIVDQKIDDFNDLSDDVFEESEKIGNTPLQIKTIIQEKMLSDEDQDMPSLILCDDDDEDPAGSSSSLKAKGNDTFNTSDCVISEIVVNASASIPAQNETLIQEKVDSPLIEAEKKVKHIQKKYFTPYKVKQQVTPKIVVDFAQDAPKISEVCNTPSSAIMTAANATPVSTVKRNPSEKSCSDKITPRYRFPTPFKSKLNLNFSKIDKENAVKTVTLFPMSKEPKITTLEPKEIVLRSIRKRSLSVTVDCERPKRKDQNVTFYSPANQTATIEDLDKLMATFASKNKSHINQNKRKSPRKRSISLDENALHCRSRLPRPVKTVTNLPKPASKSTLRTKLPNFSAIHEKQFQKMENLVDYVARKADRAQNLTNSALKARNATHTKSPRKIKPGIAKDLQMAPSSLKNDTADKLQEHRVHQGAMFKGFGDLNDEKKKSKIPSKSPRKTKPEIIKDLKLAPSSLKNNDTADKMKERRERHLAMFKGRRDINDTRKKNCELIKGVRSNRHFELLMEYRKINEN